MDFKKVVIEHFTSHPNTNELHYTSDMSGFFKLSDAQAHAQTLPDRQIATITREFAFSKDFQAETEKLQGENGGEGSEGNKGGAEGEGGSGGSVPGTEGREAAAGSGEAIQGEPKVLPPVVSKKVAAEKKAATPKKTAEKKKAGKK